MFPARIGSCLLISVVSMSAAARERPLEATYVFDIPRTSRRAALLELTKQADEMDLEYVSGNTKDGEADVGPIKGKSTLESAVRRILRDSKLTYRISEPNTLVVEPGGLEKTRQRPAVQPEKKKVDGGVPTAPVQTVSAEEEVTVLSRPYGSVTGPMAPRRIMDRQRLNALGVSSLSEGFGYVSQNAFVRPDGFRTSSAQYAEMRGLGSDTALVLINGRRAMPSASSLTSSAFDLNSVPLAAVDRVEFLFDTPSIASGTDAIGGVINIVYRRVTEPTVEVRHGGADGGAEQRLGSLSLGTEGDRFKGGLTLEYFDVSGLLGAERDRWSDQDHRRLGGRDQRSRLSSIGNFASVDGRNLPGLTAPYAAVPIVDPTPGISLDDFVATAGSINWESLLKYSSVVPEATRIGLVANASYDLGDSREVSFEVLYSDRNSTFFFCPPALYGLPVAPSNAYTPFDTTVLAYRLIPDLGSQYQYVESELLRTTAQLRGQWGKWQWSFSALHSREQSSTWFHNELDLTAEGPVMRALASSDPAQALNLFQNGPLGSADLLQSLLAPPHVDHFISTGDQLMAHVEGPLFRIPAGAVIATLGAEWRQELALFDSRDLGWFDSERDISSAFLQLQVPLVSEDMALPGIRNLSVVAGSRVDRYDGMHSVIRSQYGLHWTPLRPLTVRVSAGRSFRPPSLYELHLPKTTTLFTVLDPARGNEPADIAVISGGNETLKPTTAKTFTAGFVLASSHDKADWNVSVDYWRVDMDDRVATVSPLQLVANEAWFPDRVVRADRAGTGDLPAPLQTVDSSRINTGRIKISGVDFSASGDFRMGQGNFKPELNFTWFDSFSATDLPGQPAVERVNLASDAGSILEWRAILSLGWMQGPYEITAAARYSPEYDDAIAGVRTGREVDSQTLFDLHGAVDVGKWFDSDSALNGLKLTVGAFNVLNTAPSVSEVSGPAAFDTSQGDLKQSSYYLRVEKKF